jgi:hypothetical protein
MPTDEAHCLLFVCADPEDLESCAKRQLELSHDADTTELDKINEAVDKGT